MGRAVDYLNPILARKRREIERRRRHAFAYPQVEPAPTRIAQAVTALTRGTGARPHVIAEIKLRSPSAGEIRPRAPGGVSQIARGYERAGASALSVLCDRVGFGGGPLDLRRAAACVELPVLFKEFVLDPVQLALARAIGAHMVLLLVRALPGKALDELVAQCLALGLAPVVEAADEAELERALQTAAPIVGVNARDLRTFKVDMPRALAALSRVPEGTVAVHMSGVATRQDLMRVADSRADAALIGESLMRAADPADRLAGLLRGL